MKHEMIVLGSANNMGDKRKTNWWTTHWLLMNVENLDEVGRTSRERDHHKWLVERRTIRPERNALLVCVDIYIDHENREKNEYKRCLLVLLHRKRDTTPLLLVVIKC